MGLMWDSPEEEHGLEHQVHVSVLAHVLTPTGCHGLVAALEHKEHNLEGDLRMMRST